MNETGIPFSFGRLGLELVPSFSEEIKLKSVNASFVYSGKVITPDPLTISNNPVLINTKDMGEHTTDVLGKMYLDSSREKFIFEGSFFEEEILIGPFWLEILPNSNFNFNTSNKIFIECPEYPASIGDLSFYVVPAYISNGTRVKYSSQEGVTFELKRLVRDSSGKKVGDITYLLTKLFEGRAVRGIDTFALNIKDHLLGDKNRVDFEGDVGVFQNRLYIDGNIKIDSVVCSYVYFEMGINGR